MWDVEPSASVTDWYGEKSLQQEWYLFRVYEPDFITHMQGKADVRRTIELLARATVAMEKELLGILNLLEHFFLSLILLVNHDYSMRTSLSFLPKWMLNEQILSVFQAPSCLCGCCGSLLSSVTHGLGLECVSASSYGTLTKSTYSTSSKMVSAATPTSKVSKSRLSIWTLS